ncbi:MAG: hypothetical protein H0T46_23795 [Deltaproteobacteria bacterium]|nr:hypothetical protein [Deltaproteobacteria bacterium]
MSLAKDEVVGLIVAAVVGVAALASFAYQQGKSTTPSAPEKPEPPPVVDPQEARAELSEKLAAAFDQDQNPATVAADGTALKIRWEMCSKQMLSRLLRDDAHYQVQNIRQLSGISIPLLKKLGFKRVECDDGRQGLKPAVETL